jgi:crotonobetainyl-CoA:carnitine CoA-transferase CaiB-like acyl-CoA transferase
LITGVVNDAMWPDFCEALGLEELAATEAYRTNAGRVVGRGELQAQIAGACEKRTTAYWLERLHARGLLAAPIRTVGQAVDDPAAAEMGLLVSLKDYPGVYATRLTGTFGSDAPEHVPRLGEHTHEVLEELVGLSAADIELLTGKTAPTGGLEEAGAR